MFRNREIYRFTVLWSLIAIAAVCTGFMICVEAGILAFVLAVSYGAAFFLFTKARYKDIARLSDQIDLVLHNGECFQIDEEREGELSILQSEITKMTVRIREQNAALQEEKTHLADSLADIAHQLRTPLTSINLILSLLENNPDEKERRDLLREMEELLLRMDWLITSLLKLSRLDAGIVVFQREKIDIGNLVDTALRPLSISMELHNIAIVVQIKDLYSTGGYSVRYTPVNTRYKAVGQGQENKIQIWGDLNWLSEAIQNIIKNCMETIGDNGKIEIICEDTALYTEIMIHDNGPGIKESDLPCLFDRFYQGENSGRAGYGIGLALCKTIITRQGGTVMAKNHPEGGAAFYIRFSK